MRINPFYDSWLLLIGETDPHLGIGAWRYLMVAIFWALAIASIFLAYRNWQADPAQRTQVHFGTWLARVAIGAMWFEELSLEAADPVRRLSILAGAGGEICGLRCA